MIYGIYSALHQNMSYVYVTQHVGGYRSAVKLSKRGAQKLNSNVTLSFIHLEHQQPVDHRPPLVGKHQGPGNREHQHQHQHHHHHDL